MQPVLPDDLTAAGPGVFYTGQPLVLVDGAVVAFLKEAAAASPTRRARLCAHPSPDAEQHDMIVAVRRDSYVAPHRHDAKSETLLVLEGLARLLLFAEDGRLSEVVPIGPVGSRRPFFYRMPARQFHSLHLESEALVFLESALGPWRPQSSHYAPWAPAPDRQAQGRAFLEQQLSAVGGS